MLDRSRVQTQLATMPSLRRKPFAIRRLSAVPSLQRWREPRCGDLFCWTHWNACGICCTRGPEIKVVQQKVQRHVAKKGRPLDSETNPFDARSNPFDFVGACRTVAAFLVGRSVSAELGGDVFNKRERHRVPHGR